MKKSKLTFWLVFASLLLTSCSCAKSEQSSDASSGDASHGTSDGTSDGTSPTSSDGTSEATTSSEPDENIVDPNDFVYADVGEGYTLCAYYGDATEIVVPETYNGKSVIALEQWAFFGRENLQSVTLPDSVKVIGEDAFANCVTLKTVNLGNGVEHIGFMAFDNCLSLESIYLPDSVVRVDSNAFANCSALTNVRMSANITKFGANVFNYSDAVNFTIYENGKYVGNPNVAQHAVFVGLVDSSQTTLKLHPDTRIIADRACRESAIEEVTFWGNKLHTIGSRAFENCNNLASIYLPNCVTTIGNDAFSYCGLTSAKLGKGLKHLGDSAFYGCAQLTSVSIPEGLAEIGTYVFEGSAITYNEYDNGIYIGIAPVDAPANPYFILVGANNKSHITTLEIHADTCLIAAGALYGCNQLTSITIPAKVSFIGSQTFGNCPMLDSFTVASENEYFESPTNNKAIVEKETKRLLYGLNGGYIPEGVEIIGKFAFDGRVLTEEITIPNTVTTIEYGAYQSTRIPSIIIPDSVTKMENGIFQYCEKLTSVTLSNNLKVIDEWTFASCKLLTSIIIPDSVTMIKERAFNNCNVLASVTFGPNVTFIDDIAFQSCLALNNLVFPESLRIIRYGAFANCQNLTTFNVGKNVRYIGLEVVADTPALTSIEVDAANKHYDSRDNCKALIDTKMNSIINGCKNTMVPNSIVDISSGAFRGSSIETITLPASVTDIGNSVFNGCSALKTVTIKGELTVITDYCFRYCTSLLEVDLPDSIMMFGSYAFGQCSALTNITLPESLVSISSYAFDGCTSLVRIIIPESVTQISNRTFRGCNNLTIYAEATELPPNWSNSWNPENRPVYWYSEEPNPDGNHWHYVDGVPTVWA
ncbi:MAG: hypothetical protein BWY30_00642 [Tenericutes bacterium ADurb.Bin239]|nr:MAG: hypothetical protein BWY30_00642 [Tenericutes bacterium ADurb.Bin239]